MDGEAGEEAEGVVVDAEAAGETEGLAYATSSKGQELASTATGVASSIMVHQQI